MQNAQTTPLLEAQNLSRVVDGQLLVDDLTFSLRNNEITGFLGLNGAGKSTTLRMLAGVIAPSEGHVRVNGKDLEDHPVYARSQIGFLPDIPPLYPDMRVQDYLKFAARIHRVPRRLVGERVEFWLDRLSLTRYRRHRNAQLSKGYRQRVALAQALLHNPSIVLLDEPASGLDPSQLLEMRSIIGALKEHCSVLMSTHLLSEVTRLCDRVLVLHEGKLVYQGTPQPDTPQQSSLVRFDRQVGVNELGKISGISHADPVSDNQWAITPSLGQHHALLRNLLEAGLNVTEFIAEKPSLDALFSALINNKPPKLVTGTQPTPSKPSATIKPRDTALLDSETT